MIRILILSVIIIFFSCERDDICDDLRTPNAVIGFYQVSEGEEIKTDIDYIKVIGIGSEDVFLESENIDEIRLPLDIAKDSCLFQINISTTDSIVIKFSYQREFSFVSKACGFKVVFNDVSIEDISSQNGTLYDRIRREKDFIHDETDIHFKIFFTYHN